MTILSFWWIRKQRGPHGNNVKINLQLKQEKSQETSLCPKKIKRFNPATETGRGYIFQQATQAHILMILSASYKYKPVIPPTYLSTYVHTSGVLHKCEKRLSPLPICALWGYYCIRGACTGQDTTCVEPWTEVRKAEMEELGEPLRYAAQVATLPQLPPSWSGAILPPADLSVLF